MHAHELFHLRSVRRFNFYLLEFSVSRVHIITVMLKRLYWCELLFSDRQEDVM